MKLATGTLSFGQAVAVHNINDWKGHDWKMKWKQKKQDKKFDTKKQLPVDVRQYIGENENDSAAILYS